MVHPSQTNEAAPKSSEKPKGIAEPERPSLGSVLFADLVAATRTIAGLDAEDARDMLDEAIEHVRGCIHRFGGKIASVQGDGVMAVFGTSPYTEDHALRACCAAQMICDTFKQRKQSASGGRAFDSIRVGVHSGSFISRYRPNDLGGDFQAIGPVVFLAAKTQQASRLNTATITHETCKLAGPAVETIDAPSPSLDEFDPIELKEISAITLHQGIEQMFASEVNRTFVGRREIVQGLSSELENLSNGAAFTSVLVGEAGMGKSRLLFELLPFARSCGLRTAEIRALSLQQRSPYAALRPFILDLLGASLSPGAQVEDLVTKSEVSTHLHPAVQELAGEYTKQPEWRQLTAQTRKRNLLAAFASLVSLKAAQQPLLILVEDIHNLDQESMQCLMHLQSACEDSAIGLLATSRPERLERTRGMTPREVELEPLGDAEATQLARSYADPDGRNPQKISWSVERAEGNPFFLQELMAGASESELLGVENISRARLDRLTGPALRAAQVASLIGEHIEKPVLGAAADLSPHDMAPVLDELIKGAVFQNRKGEQLEFRHELIRETTRRTLLRSDARQLHKKLVSILEAQPLGNRKITERLAHHCEHAGDYDGALGHIRTAIRHAIQNSSVSSVVAMQQWAESFAEKAHSDGREALVDIMLAALDVFHQIGDMDRYESALNLAISMSLEGGDKKREAVARAHNALVCWMRGDHQTGLQNSSRAFELAKAAQSLPTLTLAQFNHALTNHALGNLSEAIDLQQSLLEQLGSASVNSRLGAMLLPAVRSHAFVAYWLAQAGRFDEAHQNLEDAERILRQEEQPYSLLLTQTIQGAVALLQLEFQSAVKILRSARELCLSHEFFTLESCITGWLAIAGAQTGDEREALEFVRYSFSEKLHLNGGCHGLVHLYQGGADAAFVCGETELALKWSNDGLRLAQRNKEPINIALASFTRGQILLNFESSDQIEQGRELLTNAIKTASEIGLQPLVCCGHAALAVAAERHGDTKRAAFHLKETSRIRQAIPGIADAQYKFARQAG